MISWREEGYSHFFLFATQFHSLIPISTCIVPCCCTVWHILTSWCRLFLFLLVLLASQLALVALVSTFLHFFGKIHMFSLNSALFFFFHLPMNHLWKCSLTARLWFSTFFCLPSKHPFFHLISYWHLALSCFFLSLTWYFGFFLHSYPRWEEVKGLKMLEQKFSSNSDLISKSLFWLWQYPPCLLMLRLPPFSFSSICWYL